MPARIVRRAPGFLPCDRRSHDRNLAGLGAGRVVDGLRTEHQALMRRSGGDQMQRPATLAGRMGLSRGIAVDGDDVGRAIAQRCR
jgi:hypothetical protein